MPRKKSAFNRLHVADAYFARMCQEHPGLIESLSIARSLLGEQGIAGDDLLVYEFATIILGIQEKKLADGDFKKVAEPKTRSDALDLTVDGLLPAQDDLMLFDLWTKSRQVFAFDDALSRELLRADQSALKLDARALERLPYETFFMEMNGATGMYRRPSSHFKTCETGIAPPEPAIAIGYFVSVIDCPGFGKSAGRQLMIQGVARDHRLMNEYRLMMSAGTLDDMLNDQLQDFIRQIYDMFATSSSKRTWVNCTLPWSAKVVRTMRQRGL